MPKVSIIVAAYDVSHCIEKSLQSLLSQTLRDIEVIVCDDCSTDNTADLVAALAKTDDRIILLRSAVNKGQAEARNRCFAVARGQYFAIHDGDDLSLPHRLEAQAAFLDAHPEYAIVSAKIRMFYDDGSTSKATRGTPGPIVPRDFLWGMPLCHPVTMFRREAIAAVEGYRVTADTFRRNEDYDMLMRMYAKGFNAFVMDETLYLYYEGADAYRRRLFRYRVAEMRIRFRNFKTLGLLPGGLFYAVKPVLVGLIPQGVIYAIRRRTQ